MKQLIILLLLVVSLQASSSQILLLQSYNKGLKWSDDLSKGVEDVFLKHKKYELTTEYMDSKKNTSKEYKDIVHKLFLKKLKLQKYDVVVVADNYAIEFVLKYKDELFKDTPLIFCGLDKDSPGIDIPKVLSLNIPVVLENKQVDTNVRFITEIIPLMEELYLINDLTLSSKLINKKILIATKKINKEIDVKLSLNGDIKKIEKDFLSLSKNSVVLFGSLFINSKGQYIPYYKVNDLIKKSPVPIFSLTDSHFGKGVIGGILSTGYVQGEESAKLVVNILEKENKKIIKPIIAEALWFFDYAVLKKYNLEDITLPNNSKVINLPKDFFEKHKDVINIIFIIFPFILISLIVAVISIILKTKAQKKLKVQKRLSEAQLNNLESFVFWIDNKGKIRGCNKSFENFIKKEKSEIINNDIDLILSFINKFITKEEIFKLKSFDFTYKSKEYFVKNKYIKDENENLEAVTIITDITDKKQAEINKQFIIQQSKLTEVGEMLSALVHQWKAPLVELSVIAHKMHYYNKKDKLNTEHIENFYENIMKQTIFMSETMDSFRGFIKTSNKPIPFDISVGIKEMLDMLKESLLYNNIKINYINIINKSIYLDGYPNEFKQVILNLINNAKDSILESRSLDQNSKKGNIEIILTQIEESVKIKILDDGLGFKDDTEKQVFEPYFTTKDEGIGIGLYMAKLIIENKMNGKINAYKRDIGAKFVITLPKGEN